MYAISSPDTAPAAPYRPTLGRTAATAAPLAQAVAMGALLTILPVLVGGSTAVVGALLGAFALARVAGTALQRALLPRLGLLRVLVPAAVVCLVGLALAVGGAAMGSAGIVGVGVVYAAVALPDAQAAVGAGPAAAARYDLGVAAGALLGAGALVPSGPAVMTMATGVVALLGAVMAAVGAALTAADDPAGDGAADDFAGHYAGDSPGRYADPDADTDVYHYVEQEERRMTDAALPDHQPIIRRPTIRWADLGTDAAAGFAAGIGILLVLSGGSLSGGQLSQIRPAILSAGTALALAVVVAVVVIGTVLRRRRVATGRTGRSRSPRALALAGYLGALLVVAPAWLWLPLIALAGLVAGTSRTVLAAARPITLLGAGAGLLVGGRLIEAPRPVAVLAASCALLVAALCARRATADRSPGVA
jgi:hypothetical protein